MIREMVISLIKLLCTKKGDIFERFAENPLFVEKVNKNDISISSNITFKIHEGEKYYYFRECRKHINYDAYIAESIDEYFLLVEPNNQLKKIITTDLKNRLNYKRFKRINDIISENQRAFREQSIKDFSIVGLPSVCNEELPIYKFLKYMRGIMNSYRENRYIGKHNFETYNSNRQLATLKFAELLGVQYLIPNVRYNCVRIGSKDLFGTIMENAEGVSPCKIPINERFFITKSFIKELSTLEIFDFLCYQLDHRMGNYNVVKGSCGNYDKVSAFDNDARLAFSCIPFIPKRTYFGAENLIICNKFNRPYIDTELLVAIRQYNFKMSKNELKKYLTRIQIWALHHRIKKIKKVLIGYEPENFDQNELISQYLNRNDMSYLKYYLTVDEVRNCISKIGEEKPL